MKTHPECIPCFVRQTLETIKLASDDTSLHEKAMREILAILSRMDFNKEPVIMGREIQQLIQRLSGNSDPYRTLKQQFNQMALDLYPRLKARANSAENTFEMAARLALAGNMIDFGIGRMLESAQVTATIELALSANLKGDIQFLERAARTARSILYLGDNCGEIVFDRLLIEQLIPDRVTYVVRAAPIINDVTMDDARYTGMTDRTRVIDNGSDAPGTLLSECSQEFKTAFANTDLIIAKGQGNYETLHASDRPIFFMLKVKCPVVARHIGQEIGSYVIKTRTLSASSFGKAG
ncbi:MAG: ARMT1-like domain-containing protein [Desulfobacterales bacterium]